MPVSDTLCGLAAALSAIARDSLSDPVVVGTNVTVKVQLAPAGNVNLALVKQALGHRSINSTTAYVGTSDRQAEAVQAALMGVF